MAGLARSVVDRELLWSKFEICWFPTIRVPLFIIHLYRIFFHKPSTLGYPRDYGNLQTLGGHHMAQPDSAELQLDHLSLVKSLSFACGDKDDK